MDDATIKNSMRSIRENLGISQEEMALRVGISTTAYRALESGGTRIMNGHMEDIAKAAGVSLSRLVNGYEPINSAEAGLDDLRIGYENQMDAMRKNHAKEMQVLRKENEQLREKLDLTEKLLKTTQMLLERMQKEEKTKKGRK